MSVTVTNRGHNSASFQSTIGLQILTSFLLAGYSKVANERSHKQAWLGLEIMMGIINNFTLYDGSSSVKWELEPTWLNERQLMETQTQVRILYLGIN
jgi:hypothetical protein